MTSINSFPTFEYAQPDDYHFSHDSVFLARTVFEMVQSQDLSGFKMLDLCAGCGIVGLDFLVHCQNANVRTPTQCDFLEVQSEYEDYFAKNISRLAAKTKIKFINANYDQLQNANFKNQYDLIVCNPPYFEVDHGSVSPSAVKNRCRFFIDSTFDNLILGVQAALGEQGNAYILMRDQSHHGFSYLERARQIVQPQLKIEQVADIRGTPLVRIFFAMDQ